MAVSDLSDKYITRARADGIWSWRFNVAGATYKDSTGTTDRAKAKKIAKDERERVIKLRRDEAALGRGPMTFARAVEAFIAEVVPSYLSMKEADARRETDFMLKYISGKLELQNIPPASIKKMALARAECLRKGRGGMMQKVKASTVNQTVDLLHRILAHAHDVHDASLRHYNWRKFRVKRQKKERGYMVKRAILPATEKELLATIHWNYLQVSRFALLSGLRAEENLLRWRQIDWDERRALDVRGKNRREHGRDVRLGRAAMAILQAEWNAQKAASGHDPLPDEAVFTYVCTRTRTIGKTGRKIIKGRRYPLTYSGWNSAWDRTKEKLGLQGKVRIHDWRHTFATRMAKKVNVRDLQDAMGHAKVDTTMGYVTVDDGAIREALDSAPMPMPLNTESGIAPLVAPKSRRAG
jgi:integrase